MNLRRSVLQGDRYRDDDDRSLLISRRLCEDTERTVLVTLRPTPLRSLVSSSRACGRWRGVVVPISAHESRAGRLRGRSAWNARAGMGYVVSKAWETTKLH
jgi:hypothetical protein